jgi:alpha-galactosidase
MNSSNIYAQLLTIEAAATLKKQYIYNATMMDPHTAAELNIKDIYMMVDELLEAHKDWLPQYE